ncbi:matrix metalloproteinase-15-like [Anneissia japonica]|uniref:matrix metalloproteinase-15-like n=1 Tax=Anneissia japonica TaxID=1529436 RepID=UPI0014258722|nr:matrix metalloproteinase-15-like [Anneissia japonica]
MLFFTALLSIILRLGDSSPVTNPNAALEYLTSFNYMAPFDAKSGQLRSQAELIEGLKRFQRFANISETGEFDEDTIEIMNLPRCGNPDFVGTGQDARRRRYAPQGSRWPKNRLTYFIENFSPDLSQTNQVRIIQAAFDIWARQTSLTFIRQNSARGADIIIKFAKGSHGDGNPFDGAGGTLAHAYFPQFGGDAHFDDAERFTYNSYSGTNLFQVAAHEFGHSLGLAHSDVSDSLMAPFYRGYIPNYKLHRDDIEGIQHLYGRKTVVQGPATPTYKPTRMPSECSGELDVMTRTVDGNTYGFKGNEYWLIYDSGAATGYPKPISEGWPGLPKNLDAGFFWERSGKTYFFKGNMYWRYTNQVPDVDYPKPVSNWRGAPANMDAVFVWSGNGRIYFVKGGQYYRYNPTTFKVDSGYPAPLSNWKGLPSNINTAMQWKNGKTYFFSGSQYWRFNDKKFNIEDGYPRLTAIWWIGCSQTAALQGAGITAYAPGGNGVPVTSPVGTSTSKSPNVVLEPNNSGVSNHPELIPILISSLITVTLCML